MRGLAVLGFVGVAACAVPLPELGEFVPARQLVAENVDTPYICGRFNPDADVCNVVATLRPGGPGYIMRTQFALRLGGTMLLDLNEELEDRGGIMCVVSEQFNGVVPEGGRGGLFSDLAGPTTAGAPFGEICYAFFRSPEGDSYFWGETDTNNALIPESVVEVVFLAERPNLGAIGLF